MTFGEFKKIANVSCFTIEAYEDIRGGFGNKGYSLYGNCDDLIVREFEPVTSVRVIDGEPYTNTWIRVKLGNANE